MATKILPLLLIVFLSNAKVIFLMQKKALLKSVPCKMTFGGLNIMRCFGLYREYSSGLEGHFRFISGMRGRCFLFLNIF